MKFIKTIETLLNKAEETAITTVYQNDIDVWLLKESDEILQEDFAEIVGRLYECYMEETSHSLLDLINKKSIALDEVL